MFKGSITALITPFDDDGNFDEAAFEAFVDWQINEGTHALVPVGTTGESPTLTHDEHHRVVERCIATAAGRVPVMAGGGSNSTREAISLTQFAQKAGADGALVVTPYYNKPSQEGLYQHYKAIHDASDIPIIIYNIPGRSVINMSVATMARLFELPRIIGVKDATGDLERCSAQRAAMGPDFLQFSGDDATALAFMASGGHGAISVSSNVAPRLCAEFQEACMAGDYAEALAFQDQLLPMHQNMFCEPSPAPAKYALEQLGICSRRVRMPMQALSSDGQSVVDSVIAGLDLKPVKAG